MDFGTTLQNRWSKRQQRRPEQNRRSRPTTVAVSILACLAVFTSLFAVWFPGTVPPTCDGPSHIYNAMLAKAVSAGVHPFVDTFQIRPFPRSNFVSDLALGELGTLFGWANGERVWITLLLMAQFAAYWYAFRALNLAWRIVLAGFLANNWFLWMGFYDFALSLAIFVLCVALTLSPSSKKWPVLVCCALIGLYSTHLFTFFAGLCVASWVFLWRLLLRRTAWWAGLGLLLPIVLLALEVFGPAVHGGIGWWGWRKVVKSGLGLALGDFLITYSWVGLLAGVLFMTLVWYTAYRYFVWPFRSQEGLPILGVLFFLVSMVAPAQVGVGTHVASRLRILGALVILLTAGRSTWKLPFFRATAISVALSLALMIQSWQFASAGRRVSEESARVSQLLTAGGVPAGAWVASRLDNVNTAAFRIVPYRHIADRSYLQARVRSIDNYEATAGNFQIQWRQRPTLTALKFNGTDWTLSGLPTSEPLWVVRNSTHKLILADGLEERHSLALGDLEVSEVVLRK